MGWLNSLNLKASDLLFFNENAFTSYLSWEELEKMRPNASRTPEEASVARAARVAAAADAAKEKVGA